VSSIRLKGGGGKCCEVDCEEAVFFIFLSSLLFSNLYENQLSGSIPSEFGRLSLLDLLFVISLLLKKKKNHRKGEERLRKTRKRERK
jgi:hypothetical protein